MVKEKVRSPDSDVDQSMNREQEQSSEDETHVSQLNTPPVTAKDTTGEEVRDVR